MATAAELTAAGVYVAHLDDEIPTYKVASPRAIKQLRAILSYYAILCDPVVVSANNLLLNEVLASLLTGEDYKDFGFADLLGDGTIVVILPGDGGFGELAEKLIEDKAHGIPPEDVLRERAKLLDERCKLRIRRRPDVYAKYTDAMRQCLGNEEIMRSVRLHDRAAAILEYAERRRQESPYGNFGQSMFCDYADEIRAEAPEAAGMLENVAGAVRHGVEAEHHNTQPGYPPEFSAAARGVHSLYPSHVSPIGVAGVRRVLEGSGVLFADPAALSGLRYQAIRTIRDDRREGQKYRDRSARAFTETTPERQCREFFRALVDYQPFVNDVIAQDMYGNLTLVQTHQAVARRWTVIEVSKEVLLIVLEAAERASSASLPLAGFLSNTWAFGARALITAGVGAMKRRIRQEDAEEVGEARAQYLYRAVINGGDLHLPAAR